MFWVPFVENKKSLLLEKIYTSISVYVNAFSVYDVIGVFLVQLLLWSEIGYIFLYFLSKIPTHYLKLYRLTLMGVSYNYMFTSMLAGLRSVMAVKEKLFTLCQHVAHFDVYLCDQILLILSLSPLLFDIRSLFFPFPHYVV